MSEKKKSGRRHTSIISMAARVIAVAIWLGLFPVGVRAGVGPPVASSPDKAAVNNAQTPRTATGGPAIHFPEEAFDFGTVSQGTKLSHTFTVKNTGDEPLKLIRAKAT